MQLSERASEGERERGMEAGWKDCIILCCERKSESAGLSGPWRRALIAQRDLCEDIAALECVRAGKWGLVRAARSMCEDIFKGTHKGCIRGNKEMRKQCNAVGFSDTFGGVRVRLELGKFPFESKRNRKTGYFNVCFFPVERTPKFTSEWCHRCL